MNHQGRQVTFLHTVPLKNKGDKGVTHSYKTPLISLAVSHLYASKMMTSCCHHELHSEVRQSWQSYLHPLFNLAVHRVPYSFISILEIWRHIMRRQLPWHYLCLWQIGLPLCLNSALCINIKARLAVCLPPHPRGSEQGDVKLLGKHLSLPTAANITAVIQ